MTPTRTDDDSAYLRQLLQWWRTERDDVQASQRDRGSEVAFKRGEDAIRALLGNASLSHKRALLFGDAVPQFEEAGDITFRDEQLDPDQQAAVERAVRAQHVALIHGPPGTGKTRTLVEIVRQALLLRRRILVTAASNIAVDNIARRLAARRIKVLRLGAAEKVSPDLVELTLHHKMAQLPEMADAQKNFDAAQRIADGKGRRLAEPGKRISELRRQAHSSRDLARANVMRRSRVVCSTAGGVDAVPLGDEKFDLVVLDEATQAPDPVALAALVRGAVLVLAGDPQQLPPTVVSQDEAAQAGLSSTMFERCSARWPAHATTLLTTQYRMSEELMRFPSHAHYEGRLEAGAENRRHSIRDLIPDATLSERDAQPWIVIDTSALGESEALDDGTTSLYNDAHRRLVVEEIRRLVDAGVEARDIAAICPYSAQTLRLRQQLSELLEQGMEIGTVDGFQGREKEVVVVDLVRSNAKGQLGFLRDVRRTNVAITRAKRQLVVIVNGGTVSRHAYYRDLMAAAKKAGAWELAGG
jgi:ATP-dependent RNA/DNA helicase IGHMBP2